MSETRRLAFMALTLLALVVPGMSTAGAAEPDRTCLDKPATQDAVAGGKARRLTEIKSGIEGEILRADLCRNGPGFVYFITAIQPDGKIKRVVLDATPVQPARAVDSYSNRTGLLP